MAGALVLLMAMGCAGLVEGGDTSEVEKHPAVEGGTSPSVEVTCEQPADNVLRWTCAVTVAPPGPVSLSWTASEGAPGAAESLEVAGRHDLSVMFLRPDTTYTVTASPVDHPSVQATTTFTTGQVPAGVRVAYTVEGTSAVSRLLHASPCVDSGYVMVSDTDGAVVWYEEVGTGGQAEIVATSLTEDDTILAVVQEPDLDRNAVVELDWHGNVLFEVERWTDFDAGVHHDAFKRDDHVYALFHEDVVVDGVDYKLDGFYVFDAAGAVVAEWRLLDVFTPVDHGGVVEHDYSHANAIHVDEDGEVTVSLRHLSAVVGVEGDWTAPDFGAIRWRLSGDPTDPDFGTDYQVTASVGGVASFVQQHHARPIGPDRLGMFDNRASFDQPSRVIGITLDPVAGTADIDQVYPLGTHCHYQGGVFFTSTGNPIATCAPRRTVVEWDADVPEVPRFELVARCFQGGNTDVPRFVPVASPG